MSKRHLVLIVPLFVDNALRAISLYMIERSLTVTKEKSIFINSYSARVARVR
jgi:hypothetical protein